ncbi:MAG: GNAT family N-acetyltransferase [Bacteroidota bacterium]
MSSQAGQSNYRKLCQKYFIPIHSQDWWFDAVCGSEGWGASVLFNKEGQEIFACPYAISQRYGQKLLKNPPLTTYLTPWIQFPEGQSSVQQYGYTHRLVKEWEGSLPNAAWHSFMLSPAWQNGMAFHRVGYELGVRYTYLLEHLQAEGQTWEGIKTAIRTKIRRAQKEILIEQSDDYDAFYNIIERSFRQNKLELPLLKPRLVHLLQVLAQREKGAVYLARDPQGRVHAGALVLLDGDRAYYSLSGSDATIRQSGASEALIWQILEDCMAANYRSFDFEGSMVPNVEPVFRYFGGTLTSYLHVQQYKSAWLRWVQLLRAR